MRRLTSYLLPALIIGALAMSPIGCKRRRHTKAEDQSTGLATMVSAADPRTAAQLTRGFHTVEQNAWRWTSGSFAVTLKPPAGAAQKGATLEFKFAVADAVIDKLKSMTLSVSVNGVKLAPETYTKAGEYTYSRGVPASTLKQEAVNVEFTLDKYLAANPNDMRDLGLIMTMIGFEAKP